MIIFFGPFRLCPFARVLKKADRPVKLGSRAFDILLVLVQRAGEVVGHKELVARVWPGVFVEEVSLRVHIAALRKALDTGEAGARYLINVRGRGYCFVAPTSREWVESSVPAAGCNNVTLRKAARRLGKLYDAVLEPSGVKATEFSLLTQIHALGHPTMAGLANSLLMDLSAMRRCLAPLIRDGLVLLGVDAKDRRVKRVVLTAAGAAKFKQAMQLWRKAQGRFEKAFGSARAAKLRSELKLLATDGFEDAF
jgi:DNA-binding winged helix-turn-helix (wHTH) protein/DNA-binding MarR family transcriptional regulator